MRDDPRWLTAKWAGIDHKGNKFAAGTKVFYYPRTRKFLQGEDAEQASRDFAAAAFDDAQMAGGW